MATYYISPFGLDTNNGLGQDPTAVTNKPWLTLGKALKAGTPVVPGDTIYCSPGVLYEGAGITVAAGIASSASPHNIIWIGFRDRQSQDAAHAGIWSRREPSRAAARPDVSAILEAIEVPQILVYLPTSLSEECA